MSYVDMIYVSVLDIPFSVSSSHKIVNQSVTESSQLHRRGEGNNYIIIIMIIIIVKNSIDFDKLKNLDLSEVLRFCKILCTNDTHHEVINDCY